MAASPPIKIYRNGEYVASTKYFDDAAAIAGMTRGTVVKWRGRNTIWTEGQETIDASESWAWAAQLMSKRVDELMGSIRCQKCGRLPYLRDMTKEEFEAVLMDCVEELTRRIKANSAATKTGL